MSTSSLIAGPDCGAFEWIDRAIRTGAVRALRTRADKQREKAAGGIAAAGDHSPGVMVRSPEAAMAASLADAFERIAGEIEAGGADMSARVIGIDIGSQGAIALLTPSGDLLEVVDMPVLRDGPKGRPNVNAALLAEIVVKMQAAMAFVEFVGARPGEGAVGRSHSAAPVASSKASVAPLAFRSHS